MQLNLVGLGHAFPDQSLLFAEVGATWRGGDLVSVTGPSGSGKSTLLSIIAGWLDPTQGRVEAPEGAAMTWVFQNPYGVARRTARDHVSLPLVAQGLARGESDRRADELLADFGLNTVADRPFSALSGGEAQRLMLARAVARSADVVLVDEPTAQLDPASAASVIAVLGMLAGRGALVVIATHDPRVREQCPVRLDLAEYQVAA